MVPMKLDEWLTTVEVADRLDVDVADVYRLVFAGELQAGPNDEGVVRVRRSELERHLQGRSQDSHGDVPF